MHTHEVTPAQRHATRTAARRKFERHAIKAAIPLPKCEQCGAPIENVHRLASPGSHLRCPQSWARKFCGNACRQAAWRARHGE